MLLVEEKQFCFYTDTSDLYVNISVYEPGFSYLLVLQVAWNCTLFITLCNNIGACIGLISCLIFYRTRYQDNEFCIYNMPVFPFRLLSD